jgi:hypothetical protein
MEERNWLLKGLGGLAFCIVIVLMAIPVSASTILYDDFIGPAGSSPDASKWTATSALTLDGAGNAVFVVPPSQKLGSLASFEYLPTSGAPIARLTYQLAVAGGSPNEIVGLSSVGLFPWGTETFIQLRTDQGGPWAVIMGNTTTYGAYFTSVPRSNHNGKWQIDWSLNGVQVYCNDVLALDTSVNLPTYGTDTTQWHIPQIAMRPGFEMYGNTGSDAIDWVNWESVPEPATMALLGCGAIVALLKRKRS